MQAYSIKIRHKIEFPFNKLVMEASVDPFQNLVDELSAAKPGRLSRTFYIDEDVYAWMNEKFGDSRGMSKFVRTLLRSCMEADRAKDRRSK